MWGCGVQDLGPLRGLPSLKELWLHGNDIETLAPLSENEHLGDGARLIFDSSLDWRLQRPHIEALEKRGAFVFVGDYPHECGFAPAGAATFEITEVPDYVTPGMPLS